MSFNADQIDYMKDLAARPPETKCYCGWYGKGECRDCPPHLSAADKLRVRCPSCYNEPWHTNPTRPITHRKGCPTPEYQPARELLAEVFGVKEAE